MMRLIWVGLGGCIGSVARYLLSGWVQNWARDSTFPWGTLSVNLIGCLVIGFVSHLAEFHGMFSASARLFLFMGVLGGFTTFSTFGSESFHLLRGGFPGMALANAIANVVLGVVLVWVGRDLAYVIWR
jgi:CrcB protein